MTCGWRRVIGLQVSHFDQSYFRNSGCLQMMHDVWMEESCSFVSVMHMFREIQQAVCLM